MSKSAMEMCSALTVQGGVIRFTPLAKLTAYRLCAIKLRLTLDELYKPEVQEWIRAEVVCRKLIEHEAIVIEIYP